MIPVKNNHEISTLMSEALRQKNLESMDKLGLDVRDIQGGKDVPKEAQIRRIAVQFEEMLLNSLLKDAFPEDEGKEDGDSDSEEGSILHFGPVRDFRIMLLSQHISDNGGLGYQEVIEKQLKEAYMDTKTDISKIENPVTKSLDTLPLIPSRTLAAPTTTAAPSAPPEQNSKPTYKDTQRTVQPVDDGGISSDFGWRIDPIDGETRFHNGIDYDVPPNTPVKSYMAGKVVFSGWEKGYGNMVEIEHPNGNISRYGHNSKLLAQEGDIVEAGEVIALSGSTGRSTGPHLHFEVRKGELALNPARILKNAGQELLAKAK